MFLATTALSDFWDKDQEILFLGPWCLRYDRPCEWESLSYQVLPSPWDDRERFHSAMVYLDTSYERILDQLAEYLNAVHHISVESRYWRILIGPWLSIYLHAFYDRFIHLTEAFCQYPYLETIDLDPSCFKTPNDTHQFIGFLTDDSSGDAYNLQLFSQVLRALNHQGPEAMLENGYSETANSEASRFHWWRRAAKAVRKFGLRLISRTISSALGWRCQVGMYRMYPSMLAAWTMAWKTRLKVIPVEFGKEWANPSPVFNGSRNGLANLVVTDEFERVLMESLPQNFPVRYLEGFESARMETSRSSTRIPPVLVSGFGWYYDEGFRFLAAEAIQRGSRLVAVQHGGGYGSVRFSAPERHEARIADSYMVWGWADEAEGPCRNLPSLKTSPLLPARPKTPKRHREGPLLFVATSHPRYLHRLQSQPVVGQWEGYIDWEVRFLSAISESTRSAVLFRPYNIDYGWALKKRISDKIPEIQWDSIQSFQKSLERCRVAIIDHPSTTFLETLASDVPTVLFWDPNLWEFRDEAIPFFEDLHRAGILWYSPREAAAHIESVQQNPWEWWGSNKVQDVRLRFVERYALTRNDWADCWAKALEHEVALTRGTV